MKKAISRKINVVHDTMVKPPEPENSDEERELEREKK